MSASKLYIPIIFRDGKAVLRDKADLEWITKMAKAEDGNPGILIIKVGEMSVSLRQHRFYRGPVIDAFVELTGEPNREYWHSHLTEMFLTDITRDFKKFIRSTAALTMREMHDYIQKCIDYLADSGGGIKELDFAEWLRI